MLKVTLAITCFNAEDTIERALQSAVGQDWANREILVVDDGSSDRSVNVIEEFVRRYPEVRLIKHEVNKGFPAALNSLLKEATGEFIAFFDDDDESCEDRITQQWQRISEYEKVHDNALVLCYGNRTVIQGGGYSPVLRKALGHSSPEPRGEAVCDFILAEVKDPVYVWGAFGSGTLMARRSVFLKLGEFDESFRRSSELDMAIRAGLSGGHFIAVNYPVITQYITKGVAGEKSSLDNSRAKLRLVRKYRSWLLKRKLYRGTLLITHAKIFWKQENRVFGVFLALLAALITPRLAYLFCVGRVDKFLKSSHGNS
jgi:glycosyltransferase involved in cell wall biosynthesis